MRRVLGVDTSPTEALLALVQGGQVLPEPERLLWPAGEATERLIPLLRSIENLLAEHEIDEVAILLPQRTRRVTQGYFGVADRLVLETMIRLGAASKGRSVTLIERATVRARLGCPLSGGLEDYLEKVIPQPVGRYWRAGRGLAAMAALAAEGRA
jgi:hypothetical protein